ncbi:MAG: hypothetical protein ABSA92_15810 [Candidatus Bathyarchaeia archaeon]
MPEVGKNETPRIRISVESLSDLIFGLALSIGAISLIGNTSTDPQVVLSNLLLYPERVYLGQTRQFFAFTRCISCPLRSN